MDIHKSEIEKYKYVYYDRLKRGEYKVKFRDGKFRCPFCPEKGSRVYTYEELLRHASDFCRRLSGRILYKDEAKHLALAGYADRYLERRTAVNKPDTKRSENPLVEADQEMKEPATGNVSLRRPVDSSEEKFVWPWMGIVANIPTTWDGKRHVGESGTKLKDELTKQGFNPAKVHPLWNFHGHSGFAIVVFNKTWDGFSNAMMFEKSFVVDHRGKEEWQKKRNRVDKLYGWVARAEEYDGRGLIGEHLRKHADLKSISEIQEEDERKDTKLVSNLTNQINVKSLQYDLMKKKVDEADESLNKVIQQKQEMHQRYNEELSKLQQSARDRFQKILLEHEKVKTQLEYQKKELVKREKDLDKREAMNENEMKMIQHEKEMNERATLEQKKADDNLLRLAQDHEMKKGELHQRIIDLEKKLDARQALELEIERMKGSVQVMKHMNEDGDSERKREMDKVVEELKEKEEELENLEEMNQTLIIKERKTNDELQEARKELVNGLKKKKPTRAYIGVKIMGELDGKPFAAAAKRKYPRNEALEKAVLHCSLWEDYLRDPNWHPFKIRAIQGKTEEVEQVIDDEDEKLRGLKAEFGDEVYQSVVTAITQLNEYNPSGRYPIPELWNFQEGKRATLKEGAAFLLRNWKVIKGRRT